MNPSLLSAWISSISKWSPVLSGAAYSSVSPCCSKDPMKFIDIQRRTGESSATGVQRTSLSWEFGFRCSALWAHDLNLGFSSSVRSHHRGPHGIASLKANKHLSASKQIPHAFNNKKKRRKSHASPLEPQCQRTCGSASRKGKSFKRAEAVIKCAALQENWNWETN